MLTKMPQKARQIRLFRQFRAPENASFQRSTETYKPSELGPRCPSFSKFFGRMTLIKCRPLEGLAKVGSRADREGGK